MWNVFVHGVGAACVNAVSSKLTLTVYSNNKKYQAYFEKGKIVTPMTVIEDGIDKTGTQVKFIFDDKIWGNEKLNIKKIKKRIQQLSYLNPGLSLYLIVDTKDKNGNAYKVQEHFCHKDGVKAYVDKLSSRRNRLTETITYDDTIDDVKISFAFAYTDYYSEDIYSFCNNIHTEFGGDHLSGFKNGIYSAIQKYALETKVIKDKKEIKSDDTREGMIGVLSVKVLEPKFEGQGKSKLKMPKIRNIHKKNTEDFFYEYLNKTPEQADIIIKKTLLAAKSRNAAKKAREAVKHKKQLMDTTGLPGKLAECQSKKPEECELFVVEGKRIAFDKFLKLLKYPNVKPRTISSEAYKIIGTFNDYPIGA